MVQQSIQQSGGHLGPPDVELGVEIIHVPERAGQKEVLPDIAEGPLDLTLGLGPIWLASPRHHAVMVQQRDERRITRARGWRGP